MEGVEYMEAIDRPKQREEILEAFCAPPVNQQIFLFTDIRGSGKTVLLKFQRPVLNNAVSSCLQNSLLLLQA